MACFNYILSNSDGYSYAGWFSWTNCDGTQQSQWISDTPIHVCAQENSITDTASDSVYTKGTSCIVNTASISISDRVVLIGQDIDDGCEEFQIFHPFSSSANLIATIGSSSFGDGYVLEGNDIHANYVVCCLDSSGVKQNCVTLKTCADTGSNSEDHVELDRIECDGTKTYSGNRVFPAQYEVDLGTDTGEVVITHQAYGIPDKFTVEWSGSTVFNSGYVGATVHQDDLDTALTARGYSTERITNLYPQFGGQPGFGSGSFTKNTPYPNIAYVKVYAPLTNTAWTLEVSCPSGSDGVLTPLTPGMAEPTNGGACLTGTTVISKDTTPSAVTSPVSFTLGEGFEAKVYLTGSYQQGYLSGNESLFLLDNNDNEIQEFVFTQTSTGVVPTYSPSSIVITGSSSDTTYKLSQGTQGYLDNNNGQGVVYLFAKDCVEKSNYQTTVDNTLTSISGVGTSTAFKVVWNSTGFSAQQQAQNLLKWLTGFSSVGSNTIYSIAPDLYSSGIKVFDSSDNEKGDINFVGTTRARYFVDPSQTVVEVTGTSGAGDYLATPTPYNQHKFRKK